MPKDLLSPAEEVRAFFSSVLYCFLYCYSCHPGFYVLFVLGWSGETLLPASLLYKWRYSKRGMILQQSQCPRGKIGRRDIQGHSGYREPRENPAAGLKVLNLPWMRPEFSENQVMFYWGSKGQALHTWIQPSKFNLLSAEYEGIWILWRAVMRALLKLNNNVCLHKAVSKTCHCSCFQKPYPKPLWCFSTSRWLARAGNIWPHHWSSKVPFSPTGSVFLWKC